MFHYIRNFQKNLKFFKFFEKKKFIKLINKYKKNIIQNENEITQKSKKILLTFDDGLKDHFYIAKKLHKEKLIGIFFINSGPYRDKKILDVHLSQLILGKVGGKIALNELEKFIKKNKLSKFINLKEKKIFSKRYDKHKDIEESKEFKKILNYYLNLSSKNKVLRHLVKKFKIHYKLSDIYLTLNEIKKMKKMGMIIGCHSNSHTALSRLKYKNQFSEINLAKEFIEKTIKEKCNHYCHPYGRKNSYNKNTLSILKKLNFKYGYSVESRNATKKDFKKKFEFPRFDCNEFISSNFVL
tara:strand:+ start:1184 stop:2074 length:891 start_codon:yes stop_codon:yes gene_type:complete